MKRALACTSTGRSGTSRPPRLRRWTPTLAGLLALLGCTAGVSPLLAQSDPVHAHIEFIADLHFETPDGRGLLPTAVAEAQIAVEYAELADRGANDLAGIQRYATYVLHAVDPAVVGTGPGLGYGLREAAAGVLREVQLAVSYDSVSENVRIHARHVEAAANNVLAWADEAVALADQLRRATSIGSAQDTAPRLVRVTRAIARGVDGNEDGLRGWPDGDEGLAQAAAHVTLMKRGEGLGN